MSAKFIMRVFISLAALQLLFVSSVAEGVTKRPPPKRAADKQPEAISNALYDTPVFNPETKSYFELVKVKQGVMPTAGEHLPTMTWRMAEGYARTRYHNGVAGRLAVIRSRSVNDFLRTTFRLDRSAWIGLFYLCIDRSLRWVTGDLLQRSEYNNWGPVWNVRGTSIGSTARNKCGKKDNQFLPVNYWSVKEGFMWNANSTEKGLRAFFVEYPTGKE